MKHAIILFGLLLAVAALPAAAGELSPVSSSSTGPRVKILRPADPASVHDASDPGLMSDPSRALSCGTPCRTGVLRVANSFFEGTVACDDGSFTVAMEATHPASGGVAQDVLFGGTAMDTSGGEVRYHVYGPTVADYPNPTAGNGSGACAFNPADTSLEVASTGIEREVTVNPSATVSLVLREELVVFGSTAADSGVRLSLQVTNRSTSTASAQVGMRWFLDFMMAGDDGPRWARVTCSPFSVGTELAVEHELLPAEIGGFFRERNNMGTPEIQLFASTTPVSGHAGTFRPDRLVHGRWSNLVPSATSPWDVVVSENDATDSDSIVFLYAGFPDTMAFTLAPGETVMRSVVLLDDCSQQASCSAPTGTVGNDLRGARAGAVAAFSWAAATLTPPDARLFRTAAETELAETPTGIGDETVIATTPTRAASDNPGTINPAFYKVLPVDACGGTVYP